MCGRNFNCNVRFYTVQLPKSFVNSESFHRLYGSTNVQTLLYYKNFPRDQTFQKCAVSERVWLDWDWHLEFPLFGRQGRSPLVMYSTASGIFPNTKGRMTIGF